MKYFLNMYGKWIDRSGKIFFDSHKELDDYIYNLTEVCLPILLTKMCRKVALNRISNSYHVLKICDSSPIKDLFRSMPVVSKPQFLPGQSNVRKKDPKETFVIVVGHDEIRCEDHKREDIERYLS